MGVLNEALYQSEKMDWETPHDLFAALNQEFAFDLDACALPHNAKCAAFYTPEMDGLAQPWRGAVWVNPPYGVHVPLWVKRAREQAEEHGGPVVCLVPCRTDTRWWHCHVMRADEVRLLTRRLTFHGAGNKAPFSAAIVVFRAGSSEPRLRVQPV